MRPISITGQGFKSFAHKQTFTFPEESGFYYLTGDNQVEPELGANGAGKSTLWDLYCWVLFGKTARGTKASDIKTWYSDDKCGGELCFVEEDVNYKLVRTWSPNTLKLAEGDGELKTVKQEDIDALIKLNYDSFLYSVLFGQVNEMFFDLKPTPKGELFSAILNLKEWDQRSAKAKTRWNELDGFVHDYKQEIAGCEGEIRAKKAFNFDVQIEEFEIEREEKIQSLKDEIEDHKVTLADIKKEGEDLVKHSKAVEEEYLDLKDVVSEAREIYEEISDDISEVKQKISAKKGECRAVEKDLDKFRSVDKVCPYCNQEVSPEHLEEEMSKLEDILDKRDAYLAKAEKELNELEEAKEDARREIKGISDDYNAAQLKLNKAKSDIDSLKRESSRLLRIIKSAKDEIEVLKKKPNPHKDAKEQVKEQIAVLKETVAKYNEELQTAEQKAESVKYWVKGFKEVRLFLISEVLTQLEVEVNNCLFQLGLKDWRIEFATDSENKSGNIRKGFAVLIYSPYNEEPVAWESWSGGESQRLRLAGALGLANLILARNGAESFVEIYDEPTAGLNDQGIQDLLETLNSRALESQKQIWIIDHRSLEFGGFNESYVAVKTDEGTSIHTQEEQDQ